MAHKDRLKRIERRVGPIAPGAEATYQQRAALAGRMGQHMADVPLERLAAYIAEAERRRRDGKDPAGELALIEEYFGLRREDVATVLTGEGGERLWAMVFGWLRTMLENPRYESAFMHALIEARVKRGLPPGAAESWREMLQGGIGK